MRTLLLLLALPALATGLGHAAEDPAAKLPSAIAEELQASADGRATVVVLLERVAPRGAEPALVQAAVAEAQEALLAELSAAGFELRCRYATFPAFAGRADEAALELLLEHERVRAVAHNGRFRTALDQSVPHIGADQVHALGLTGQGVTVAVLDTGIDTDHADLADDLAPGAWHSLGDGTDQGPGAEDDHGHGTHVSGIITSAGNVASLGAAPDVEILAIKVLDAGGNGTLVDVLAGIDYITASAPNYADLCALNMSLATLVTYPQCPCDAVDGLTLAIQASLQASEDAGILNLAASGNNSSCTSMGAPACLSAAYAVAATGNADDTIAGFTNRSPCNALAAPGEGIEAPEVGGGTSTKSGTSMATPHVAAVAALVSQRATQECLALSPTQLYQVLADTSVPTNDPCGSSPNPRRVDALAAVLAVDSGPGELLCFGDGSTAPCPCANESAAGGCAGCRNSSGEGAVARSSGSAGVGADDLVVSAIDATPAAPALLLAGLATGGAARPFGDGLRCGAGATALLALRLTQPDGSVSFGPGLAALGGWSAGELRHLQVWYRDASGAPCGGGANLSNGIAITLLP